MTGKAIMKFRRTARTVRRHGTYSKYSAGCRCTRCSRAAMRYRKMRRLAIARGTWQAMTDAGPVRQHVLAVMEATGVSPQTIALAAGVGKSTIKQLVCGRPSQGRGPEKTITVRVAERLMNVVITLDMLPDRSQVDACGTRRRLQALAMLGWSLTGLGSMCGVRFNAIRFIAKGEVRTVTAKTARAVRDLYAELWNQPAPAVTRSERKTATYARNHAIKLGWAPAAAWDEDTIDDPKAKPNWRAVRCAAPDCWQGLDKAGIYCRACREHLEEHGTFEGRTRSKDAQAVVEDAAEIARLNGLDLHHDKHLEEVAERLGVRPDTLQRTLWRYYFGKQERQPCTMAS
ncbi:hypothetical protein AB0C10_15975 [Microbispora amethystogenes]|uniref:hypothetical protein n=1 Tax=Microbispora amethystogenes TaxID=1427754 RepID=UPI0034086C17